MLREALGPGAPAGTRRAAIYGFMSVKRLRPEDFNRLLRIFQNATEAPGVRGQAAEALGPRVNYRGKPGRVRRRDALARDAFLRGLDDPEPEVRLWSIFAPASPANGWLIPKLESMSCDEAAVLGMWTVGKRPDGRCDGPAGTRTSIRAMPEVRRTARSGGTAQADRSGSRVM